MSKYNITTIDGVEISVRSIAKGMTEENFVELMEDYNNISFENEFERGRRIGKMLQYSHRTLQGSIYRLLMGILVGLGETPYFDARNEVAVANCQKIKRMLDNDELKLGYMI